MPFHKFKFHNILTISQSTQKSFISINSFNNDSTYVWPKEKISFHTHENNTHKNFHTYENDAYTSQQNFRTHQKWVYSIMPTHQILIISYPQKKIKSKFIQQYLKLHTMQSFINHQHCPNFTIPNNSTIQKHPKIKNQHDHTIVSNQSTQCPKFPQEQTTTKWQCPTIKFSTKYEINKFTNKKQRKKWTHLEIFLGWVWSMVAWVLKEPWRCKDEGLKMGFKKIGFARMLKNLRIWRNMLRDGRNQV